MKRVLVLIGLLLVLAVPAFSQGANIQLAWDMSSSDTRDPADPNPVRYRLYRCTDQAVTQCAEPLDVGTALESPTQSIPAGNLYFYVTAYWYAVTGDGQPAGSTTVESGKSNILRVSVFVPPGNPNNPRIRVVSIAKNGDEAGPTLMAKVR